MATNPPLEPSDDASIGDDEWLLRRVHPGLVAEDGRADSSNLKNDPGGIGTSVTVWRDAEDCVRVLAGHTHYGILCIKAGAIRQAGLGITFTYEEGNPNHAEVFGPRSKGKQRNLRDQARWVRLPADHPYPGTVLVTRQNEQPPS